MSPKNYNHFGHFFIMIIPCEVQVPSFLQGPLKDFYHFKQWHLIIYIVEISLKFSIYFQTSILQDLMVTSVQIYLFLNLVLILEMAIFESFW